MGMLHIPAEHEHRTSFPESLFTFTEMVIPPRKTGVLISTIFSYLERPRTTWPTGLSGVNGMVAPPQNGI